MSGFRKLPTWWFRDEKLKNFCGGKQAGESIASLKVLICITLCIDYHNLDACLSLSELELITGLSRPMVVKGVKKLEEEGILSVDRNKNVNRYILADLDSRWAKMPSSIITKIKVIPNRGVAALGSLKIYLTLLATRENKNQNVRIGYEKIRSWTGLQAIHIRPSLDILFNHSLIHISKSEELDYPLGGVNAHNVYKIVGHLSI